MQCRWPCQKLSLSIVYVCHIKGCLLTFLPMSLFVISCLSLRIASQSLFSFNANVYSLNRSAFIHSLIFNNYFFTSFFLCRVPFLFIFLCLQKYFLPKRRSKNDVFGSMPTLKNALKHSPQKCQNF